MGSVAGSVRSSRAGSVADASEKGDDNTSIVASTVLETLDREELARRAEMLDDSHKKEIRKLFDSFDIKGAGFLSRDDIRSAFTHFDIDIDYEEITSIIDHFDSSGEGIITYADFEREMQDIVTQSTVEQHLKIVFSAMDPDGDGFFGPDDLAKEYQKLGALISPDEIIGEFVKIGGVNLFGQHGTEIGLVDINQFRTYVYELEHPKKIETPASTLASMKRGSRYSSRRGSRESRKASQSKRTSVTGSIMDLRSLPSDAQQDKRGTLSKMSSIGGSNAPSVDLKKSLNASIEIS